MKITVKNLQQQTFTVIFEEEKTVLELKEQICKDRGPEYVVEKQKLIYAGVILDDTRTLKSYNLDEKKFVVVMLKRDLGVPAQKPDEDRTTKQSESKYESSKPAEVDEKQSGNEEERKSTISSSSDNDNDAAATMAPVGSGTSILTTEASESSVLSQSSGAGLSSGALPGVFSNTSLQSRAESSLLMGDEYNRTVESMIEMGYSREMVLRAMAASFNNPERAVEYLISGIPENEVGFSVPTATGAVPEGLAEVVENLAAAAELNREAPSAAAHSAAVDATRTLESINIGDAASRDDPFEFLRNQPQFLQMRSLVYQNPDLLLPVLQQIGQTNPALLQLISENQDAFLSMLNQPVEGQGGNNVSQGSRMFPGRRNQLASAVRAAGTGDGTAEPQRSSGGVNDGADSAVHANASATDRRTAADTFTRDRAAAAAAVAALTAAALSAAEGNSGSGIGGGTATQPSVASDNSPEVQVQPDGTATIRLTPTDQLAIERLKALGFPEALVLQAYFACGKDEQLAANFLISSSFDD